MIAVGDLAIRDADLAETFIRASGPGGQNVNKVATAVQLRFDLHGSALPAPVKARLARLAGSRLTLGGVVVITADRFRTQERNRADARDRLAQMLAEAARPLKLRRATRPTLASKVRRLSEKSARGRIKSDRGRPSHDD